MYVQVLGFVIITNQKLSSLLSDITHGAMSAVLVTLLFYPDITLSVHLYLRKNIENNISCHKM
jgi:hypothetical protein